MKEIFKGWLGLGIFVIGFGFCLFFERGYDLYGVYVFLG